jgi:hypothetical protein
MSKDAILREIAELRARADQLEAELGSDIADRPEWPPREFYTMYYVLAGFGLGAVAAMTSLLFNIIGSAIVGKPPLYLISVYLTFPLGEEALHIDSGLALAVGCCLYILTGTVLGIPIHLILSRFYAHAGWPVRLVVAGALGVALWLINFYGLIAWLQPLLIGGNWIVEQIPWWVAAATHLVFAWTMLVLQPLGKFTVGGSLATEA